MYDLIIIGAGPGGIAAGVYAARKKVKTLLITDSFGGQSVVSADIQNWIGTKSVSGFDFSKMLEEHLKHQEDIEIKEGEWVSSVSKTNNGFKVETSSGESFETRFILLSMGSRRKKLNVPGEKEFDGRGVVYCSTCDAPLFRNKTVAVVGGGNAGLEAVVDLLPYASKIFVFSRSGELKGDLVTQEKVLSSDKVEIVKKVETQRILGDKLVSGVVYKELESGEEKELPVEGVFIEIGSVPNSDIVKDLVELNPHGEVVVDHKTQKTSCPGIWAVGDVTDVLYKQNNISAGDAVKALLNIYDTIHKS